MNDDDRVNHERALSSLSDVLPGLPERERSTKWADSLSVTLYNRQTSGESASLPQYLGCNAVFDMVYASHFFAGRPYHFNQTLRTANKF